MQPKFVAAQKMLKKQKLQQNIRKIWLLGFITLGIYTPLGSVCIAFHNIQKELPIDMGNSICTAH